MPALKHLQMQKRGGNIYKLVQCIILACFLLTSITAYAEEPEKVERIIANA